jgi:acetyltransferase-like isoleucine patch superfamily enzyme
MIHSLAFVDCDIPESTSVWQFASVIRGAKIGEECSIGANAIVDGVAMGDGCRIGHAASLHPGTVLGRDVFIGPCVVICNDMWPSVDRDGWAMPERPTVIVDDGASIGANAVILPGVRIGRNAVVAAGAVVDRDVPEGAVWRRNGYVSWVPANRNERRMRFAKEAA